MGIDALSDVLETHSSRAWLLLRQRDDETASTATTTRVEHGASPVRRHAFPKAVLVPSFAIAGLIGAFHARLHGRSAANSKHAFLDPVKLKQSAET